MQFAFSFPLQKGFFSKHDVYTVLGTEMSQLYHRGRFLEVGGEMVLCVVGICRGIFDTPEAQEIGAVRRFQCWLCSGSFPCLWSEFLPFLLLLQTFRLLPCASHDHSRYELRHARGSLCGEVQREICAR